MYKLARYSAAASHNAVLHTTVSEYTLVALLQRMCVLSSCMLVQSAVVSSFKYKLNGALAPPLDGLSQAHSYRMRLSVCY
jgi:hypothetical protein